MAVATPKLKLYTNHGCPWAHRAHIALAELGLPFEEEIIDLTVPRTAEYLKVNPRGLVPSLAIDDEIITESGIVSAFLADTFPSHLVPASNAPGGALARARIAFFADTLVSKFPLMAFIRAKTDDEVAELVGKTVDAVVKELEPLLANAAPFFNGSDKLTLAEVLTGSFIVRLWTWPEYGTLPQSLLTELRAKAPNFARWAEAVATHPSVTGIFDAEGTAVTIKARFGGR
ncbi:thioredoxin-like protein [Xylaria intraflava]|nr:thioredoxin-like protein [Xylaria intraflava]